MKNIGCASGERLTNGTLGLRRGIGRRGWGPLLALALAIAGAAGAGCDSGSSPATNPDGGGQDTRSDTQGDTPTAPAQKLVILHTGDIHSHFMGQQPEADYTPATLNDDTTVGGMARLGTAIVTAKTQAAAAQTPVLLLDAGDFMMGTLFSFLATDAAPELTFMRKLGYDATTIGNHELDWTPLALAGILQKAAEQAMAASEAPVPVLASNMTFSPASTGDDGLEALWAAGVILPKVVKTVGTIKVGLFGLMGKDAADVTPQKAPLTFESIVTASQAMVTELRQTDGVDLVIALSHSGISSAGAGEDKVLAQMVPGIDVIVSGHTHDTLTALVTVGKTIIVAAGSYGRFLGRLQLSVTPGSTAGASPTVAVDGYVLQSIDDQIMGDATTQGAVDQYIGAIDGALTAAMPGLAYKAVVAETAADIAEGVYQEAPIGNLVTDAYRMITAQLQPSAPPVISVEGNGQLRTSISKGTTGQIWFADLFRVTPIGIGPDKKPGFPLVTYYLNAVDIKSGLELGAAGPAVDNQYFLQVSGLKAEYDMTKPPFGRVASIKLDGETDPLDLTNTTRCFKVVTTNYVAGLLGVVATQTGGALPAVVAKEQDCATPIPDPTIRFVDAAPMVDGVQELKQWQAVLKYVTSPLFMDTDQDMIPNVPAMYTMPLGRIVKRP